MATRWDCRGDVSANRLVRPLVTMRLNSDVAFLPDHLSGDLASRSVRGGMSTFSFQLAKTVIQMVSVVVLARVLTPDDFGLIAMVAVVLGFMELFKDAGLTYVTIQQKTISVDQASALFWVNMATVSALGMCILALSPLVARFYNQPALTAVCAALSLAFVLNGLSVQHDAMLRRHMRFTALGVSQTLSRALSTIVCIALAIAGWGYWALVAGTFALSISSSLISFFMFPWVPGRPRRGSGVRPMLRFGTHMVQFEFVAYFSRNMDNILVGKFIGADGLGLYSRAFQLFMQPFTQIRAPLIDVALPVLSSLRTYPSRYRSYYERLLDVTATLTVPLAVYSILEADFIVRVMLGYQWIGVVPVFRILAVAGILQAVATTRGTVLVSLGNSKKYYRFGLINSVVMVTAYAAGLRFGIAGVAAGYAIASYAVLVPSLLYCFADTPVTIGLFMRAIAPSLMVTGWAAISTIVAHFLLLRFGWLATGIIATGVFALVYVSLSLRRPMVREMLARGVTALSFPHGNLADEREQES